MMNEPISSIMSKNVVTVKSGDSLTLVQDLLFNRHFHHLPVTDHEGHLKGILTSWDLLKNDIHQRDYSKYKVEDVMTPKVVTLGPDDKVGTAAMIFLKHLFHGLPIVNADNAVVGIVTTHDILMYEFRKEYPDDDFIKDTNWITTVGK